MSEEICGATVTPISDANQFLDWITGRTDKPVEMDFDVEWALAICTDGVVWGILRAGLWELSSTVFNHCPPVSIDNLLELRIFGQGGEALIWKDDCGLAGRLLVDSTGLCQDCSTCLYRLDSKGLDHSGDPLAPFCQEQILVGPYYRNEKGSFVHVATNAGREQVLPIPGAQLPLGFKKEKYTGRKKSPFRLYVKYYLSQESSGAVRISAARLAKLGVES